MWSPGTCLPLKKNPAYSSLFFLSFSLTSFSFLFFLFVLFSLAQIPAKWCQNNISMHLMTCFIFVKDGRKGSDRVGIKKRELESVLLGYWDFSASAASGFWWMFQDVKTVLHVIGTPFTFSKQMLLISRRRKGRTIQA